MREYFAVVLLALMQGKESLVRTVLTAEHLELMFQVGREYGFWTATMQVEGFTSTQVAIHQNKPISLKISMRLVECSLVEVCIKRISEKESRTFIEKYLN